MLKVADRKGRDTANFDLDCVHLLPIFAGWGGKACLGGKGAWFQSSYNVGVTCHEFGHNTQVWSYSSGHRGQ